MMSAEPRVLVRTITPAMVSWLTSVSPRREVSFRAVLNHTVGYFHASSGLYGPAA